MTSPACLHFVGFRGDEYVSAKRVFGAPDFFHIGWDLRAQREIAPGDMIVFAKGDGSEPPSTRSFPDIDEEDVQTTCPKTQMPCDGLHVGAGWDCEAHGCWKRHGREDRDLKQRGPR